MFAHSFDESTIADFYGLDVTAARPRISIPEPYSSLVIRATDALQHAEAVQQEQPNAHTKPGVNP